MIPLLFVFCLLSFASCFKVSLPTTTRMQRRSIQERNNHHHHTNNKISKTLLKSQVSETYSTITKTSVAPPTSSGSGSESTKIDGFGKWEELHGNYALRPSVADGPPRALLHFLGGAFV